MGSAAPASAYWPGQGDPYKRCSSACGIPFWISPGGSPRQGLRRGALSAVPGLKTTSWKKCKCRTGLRANPTPEQAVKERSRVLLEAKQFAANPFATLQEYRDSDPEWGDRSDSDNSTHGPSLTPRSADDI
ncbi:hypothetical protein NDU88_005084 [Pleurodeles waltl]|uniref:Uncharacterized protein n=1 Tax=Pleurodeles waltl TaxID=8319 RepID=A0AAV7TTS5_PLEWA|nr:hypothetical protein NDU88_005084 [Pleurodeles waltl]